MVNVDCSQNKGFIAESERSRHSCWNCGGFVLPVTEGREESSHLLVKSCVLQLESSVA